MTVAGSVQGCLVVIFGASGDLTRRKLVPALFDLRMAGLLPEAFGVVGVSRTAMSDEAFREHLAEGVRRYGRNFDAGRWGDFARRISYYAADSTRSEDYPGLKQHLARWSERLGTGPNLLLYLALAPPLHEPTIRNIAEHHLVTEGKSWCSLERENRPWQRLVIEKPLGHDLASAEHLDRVLGRAFEEEVIYRIDHYLGKETVQNLLVFRFANTIFEPIWNRSYIDHIQVTAMETVGVEGRGAYYDSLAGGALRDMVQSHLLQLMALVAMEPPVSMRAEDVRSEKIKVLQAVRALKEGEVTERTVRGQYGPGVIDGQSVVGYRQEKGVRADSARETYAALSLWIDTWRWAGVPFYLRSGKRLAAKSTEIVVAFRPTPHCLFRDRIQGCESIAPNQIVINVQPNEGIRLRFEGKVPGTWGSGMQIRSLVMDFDYQKQLGGRPPEAYATLLLDVMRGDQTLFKHREEAEQSWRIVQTILDYWQANPPGDFPNYAAGTWGPPQAEALLERDGRRWHLPQGAPPAMEI